ncbi:hypothetical protein H0H92_004595 [Tricholoma furcatifolium]|nr:hypothetical protein H0H92_004595 [Tricholoma furcatifolium]
MRASVLLLFLPASYAFQLPFQIPFFSKKPVAEVTEEQVVVTATPRIAIIGAGAGGSSAAFWISKARERFGIDVELDVYEKESYIGGRSITVHPYENTSLPSLELGASIFVSANKNLWRASDEFNLTRRGFESGDQTGIWDGQELLFTFGDSWWDTLKVLWRFGLSAPKRTEAIVNAAVERYLAVYTSELAKWNNIADIAAALGYSDMLNDTAASFFAQSQVSRQFATEMIEGATRVNYGQNLDDIHGLGAVLSLATPGARGIEGGNFQIFEQFLERSGAEVHLNTEVSLHYTITVMRANKVQVTSISKSTSTSSQWAVKSSLGVRQYKAVILAAPFHSTGIAIPSPLADLIPEQPYVHLHVTLLTTTSPKPNPAYFGQASASALPEMMLTTYGGVRNGGKEPDFNSLSYHGLVREGEWAVKIFSKERISDELLEELFSNSVGWVFRKEWDAYPKLTPTTTFPPIKVDSGLYYVNAFEPMISTMETETVAARNVVELLLNEEFEASLCGSHLPPSNASDVSDASQDTSPTSSPKPEFVFGWDC